MKYLYIKEEGKSELIKKGTEQEIIKYLQENFSDLFGWVWDKFGELREEEKEKFEALKKGVKDAQDLMDIDLDDVDHSWWTIYVTDKGEKK